MHDSTLLSKKYKQALELVAILFANKTRDLNNIPFVTHLYGVAHIIARVCDDEQILIAGLLHDVLEDIPASIYSADDLKADFGARVYELVKTVSHDEEKYGKEKAREIYLDQIRNAHEDACIISAADLLYNARDIVILYEKYPVQVKEVLGGERAKRRSWFWGERFKILESKLGQSHTLIIELKQVLEDLDTIHKKII